MAPLHPPDQLGDRGRHFGRLHRRHGLRADRRRDRAQEGLRHRRRHHDLRGPGLGLRPRVPLAGRGPIGPGLGHRRRLPGLRRPHERVLQPQGPRPPGRTGLLDAGPGPDHRSPGRPGPALIGPGWQPDLAPPARLGCAAGRRCGLPAFQDARIAPLPGPGPRRRRPRRPGGDPILRGRYHRIGQQRPHLLAHGTQRPGRGSSSTTPTTATPSRCRPS